MEGTNLSCKKSRDPILLFQNFVQYVLIILNNIIQVPGYLCSCNFMEEKNPKRKTLKEVNYPENTPCHGQ